MDDIDGMKEDQVEMKTCRKIKMKFHSTQLSTFWCTQLNLFLLLAKTPLEVIVPFATT